MALKCYNSVKKMLTKSKKVLGVIPTFAEVTGEKMTGPFCRPS